MAFPKYEALREISWVYSEQTIDICKYQWFPMSTNRPHWCVLGGIRGTSKNQGELLGLHHYGP
jgi:hypothetical protein